MLEQLAKQCDRKTASKKSGMEKKPDDISLLASGEKGDEVGAASDEESVNKNNKTVDAPKSPSTEEGESSAFGESTAIKRFIERTRDIVDTIDKQVAEAQNIQRLAEIQRNIDTSGLEKFPDSPITNEYRVC